MTFYNRRKFARGTKRVKDFALGYKTSIIILDSRGLGEKRKELC